VLELDVWDVVAHPHHQIPPGGGDAVNIASNTDKDLWLNELEGETAPAGRQQLPDAQFNEKSY